MRTPNPSTDELLGFILGRVQYLTNRTQFSFPEERTPEIVTLYGPIARTHRFASAYLKLSRAGFAREGRVLVRSAFEHALTVQWAYLTPNGPQRLRNTMHDRGLQIISKMMEDSDNPDLRPLHEKWSEPTSTVTKKTPEFSGDGILGQLDPTSFLAKQYKLLSQETHVSHLSMIDHIEFVDDQLVFLEGHISDSPDFLAIYALAISVMLTSWVLARLTEDSHELKRLDALSDALLLPTRLDDSFPQKRRRFKDGA